MTRILIWVIGWTVFLCLALASAFFIARLMPYEGNGQAITGSGLLFFLLWCPSILLFSALAAYVRRALMRQAGLIDTKKKAPPQI